MKNTVLFHFFENRDRPIQSFILVVWNVSKASVKVPEKATKSLAAFILKTVSPDFPLQVLRRLCVSLKVCGRLPAASRWDHPACSVRAMQQRGRWMERGNKQRNQWLGRFSTQILSDCSLRWCDCHHTKEQPEVMVRTQLSADFWLFSVV